ncbi:hypothetical protein BDK51DRAFT_33638 [Blyttiomyces helicus]|uniref:Uncharacterized protein n=1 Tax=Blyttiomyces helicus TaxID=388810 RepID=A0A4P9WMH6_9FUNG|nr:hypothetical protein BDK51DRAFT_33638 [Blyttiomyces helicus]|eukprot:RKO94114.1 hypothetical protein BDK51DRAFT_33638 [Blyttiomyces helicus]
MADLDSAWPPSTPTTSPTPGNPPSPSSTPSHPPPNYPTPPNPAHIKKPYRHRVLLAHKDRFMGTLTCFTLSSFDGKQVDDLLLPPKFENDPTFARRLLPASSSTHNAHLDVEQRIEVQPRSEHVLYLVVKANVPGVKGPYSRQRGAQDEDRLQRSVTDEELALVAKLSRGANAGGGGGVEEGADGKAGRDEEDGRSSGEDSWESDMEEHLLNALFTPDPRPPAAHFFEDDGGEVE